MSTAPAVDTTPPTKHNSTTQQSYGENSDRETPGPIPNPEAKPASADDTTQPGWKSRTPPNTHKKGHPTKVPFFTPTRTNRKASNSPISRFSPFRAATVSDQDR